MRLIDYNSTLPSPPAGLPNLQWQHSDAPDPIPIVNISGLGPYTIDLGTGIIPVGTTIVFVQGGGHQAASGTWDITGNDGASTFQVTGHDGATFFRPGPACNVYFPGKASAYLPQMVGDTNASPPTSPPAVIPLGGAVPPPSVGDGIEGKVLRADGTWGYPATVSGGLGGSPPVPQSREIFTTAPLTGGGFLSSDLTLGVSVFGGDAGSGGTEGVVPAPVAGDTAAGKFLSADGGWELPPAAHTIFTSPPLTGGGPLTSDLTLRITVFGGDGGSPPTGGTEGAVPAPAPGDASAGKFLSADGAWEVPQDVPLTRQIITSPPLTGGGALSADLTLGISIFGGDGGSPPTGGSEGAVPAPAPGDAAAGKYLSAGGGWSAPADVPLARQIITSPPLQGGGNLSADLTLSVDVFGGDAGSGGTKGAVPAPAAGDAAAGKFLSAGGGWSAPILLHKYSASFSAATSVTVAHNLGTTAVVVAVWDGSSPPQQLIPEGLVITDSNTVTLTFGVAQSGSVVVMG